MSLLVPDGVWMRVDLAAQTLDLMRGRDQIHSYPVSTALKGAGERENSGCTPRGWHYVRAHIGAGLPLDAVLRGRRWTGEIWSAELNAAQPQRDWILTRILWLCGSQPGFNRLGGCDTFRRYIYIHGTPPDQPMGEPRSHGCVRMRSADVLQLFEQVPPGCPVLISEGGRS